MTGINKQQTAHHDTHRAGHNEQQHDIFLGGLFIKMTPTFRASFF